METRRENDCITKYLLDEFEDLTSRMFAIGMKTDASYPGVYEWNRVDTDVSHPEAATLTFSNWLPSKIY